MYLDLDYLEEYLSKHKKEFLKVRNIYLYKKLTMEIEEIKFNDMVINVLEKMIELKNQDSEKEKHRKKYETHQLKAKKAAVFNKLLASALNSVIIERSNLYLREPGKNSKHETLVGYFEELFPDKRLEALEKTRKRLSKKNDILKCGGVSPFMSPKRVPIQEPEPEIMVLKEKTVDPQILLEEYIPSRLGTLIDSQKSHPTYISDAGGKKVSQIRHPKGFMIDEKKRRKSVFDRKEKRIQFQIEIDHRKHNSQFQLPSDRSLDAKKNHSLHVPSYESLPMRQMQIEISTKRKSQLAQANQVHDSELENQLDQMNEEEAQVKLIRTDFKINPNKFKQMPLDSRFGLKTSLNEATKQSTSEKPKTRLVQQNINPKNPDQSVESGGMVDPYKNRENDEKNNSAAKKSENPRAVRRPIPRSQPIPTEATQHETGEDQDVEDSHQRNYAHILETEGQNLLTIEDEYFVNDDAKDQPQESKNFALPELAQLSFEEQFLSEDDSGQSDRHGVGQHSNQSHMKRNNAANNKSQFQRKTQDPDQFNSERKNLIAQTNRDSSRSSSQKYDHSWMLNEYDYLIDKMARKKLEILEEEDKFSCQYPAETVDSATIEIQRIQTQDLGRKTFLMRSLSPEPSEDSYVEHGLSSDEESEIFPLENFKPKTSSIFNEHFKDQLESVVCSQKLRTEIETNATSTGPSASDYPLGGAQGDVNYQRSNRLRI